MNKAKLTALCHKISKQTGLTFNSVMTCLFFYIRYIVQCLMYMTYRQESEIFREFKNIKVD